MGRILYIADIDCRGASPTAAKHVMEMAGGFAELGHHVTLLVPRGGGGFRAARAGSEGLSADSGSERRLDIHRAGISGLGTRGAAILYGRAARRLGRQHPWDLIVCRDALASIVLARAGIKHVFEMPRFDPGRRVEERHLPVLRSLHVQRVVMPGGDHAEPLVELGVDAQKIVMVPAVEDSASPGQRARRILECVPPRRPPRRRVLHIISSFAPLIGGAERQVEELSRLQVRAGDEVEVLTRRRRGWPAIDGLGPVGVRRVGPWYLGGPGFFLAALAFAFRHRRRFDVLHAHQARTPAVVAALARRLGGAPAVALLVGGDVPEGRDFRSQGRLLALRRLDRVAAVSGPLAGQARAVGLQDVVVIPTGVDAEYFSPAGDRDAARRVLGLGDDELLVLYVGRLELVKGVDLLCDAWPLAATACPRARLVVVGRGSLELSATHPSMTFVGRVPDTRVYYRAADILVQPSRSEGLSIVLLEGMASGLAVVATSVPGNSAVVEHGVSGILVPPAEPAPLAAAIVDLLEDPERRRRLGAAARGIVLDRFRLEAIEEQWARLYEDLGRS